MRRIKIAFALLLAAAWLAFIVRHNSDALGGADSSGYFNEAKLFASGRLSVPTPSPLFTPLGFVASPKGGAIVPMYPPGYPLHLALFWFAPFYVTPVAALLCLLATFALARTLGLSEELSFGAAFILGTAPTFLLMAVQPMSDVVSMLWCALAMLFALRKRPTLAGVAFAIAVWVRPSNLLLALPLAMTSDPVGRRRLAGAAIPFGIALMLLNHAMYGKWLTTGYGSINYMLSWTNPITRAPQYLRWLALYAIGLFVIFDKRVDRKTRALLLIWFGVFFVFYCFFAPIGEWGYTRFLLPAFPPMIIGLLLLLREHRAVAAVVILAIAVYGWTFTKRQYVFNLRDREAIYPQTIAWAEQRLPRDAVVASMQLSGAFYFYANRLTLRYDLADAIPNGTYAVIFDWEKLPGRWKPLAHANGASLMQRDDVTGEVKPQNGAGDQR